MGKLNLSQKHKKWLKLKDFDGELRSDGKGGLWCLVCDKSVNPEMKSQLKQDVETSTPSQELVKQKSGTSERRSTQLMLTEMTPTSSSYSRLVTNALVHANIPFNVLNNQHFRRLLMTNSNGFVPAESTVRCNYLPKLYDETMEMIKRKLKGKRIWVSIDETKDVTGRYVACFVVGDLSDEAEKKSFLFNCASHDHVNFSTISTFFDDSINLLWGNEKTCENVLLFLSDGAEYMKKAGKHLKGFYPRLIHVTCLPHAIQTL
jgi:hypothetical protein